VDTPPGKPEVIATIKRLSLTAMKLGLPPPLDTVAIVFSSGMGAPFAVDFGTAYKLAPSLVKTLVELTPSALTMTPLAAIPMVSGKQTPPWQRPPRHECPQAPQFKGSDARVTHAFEQAVVPLPHEMPHFIPSQVAVAFAGAVHGVVQVVPQVIGLLFAWHELPHA
jgi:hypothetical protein